jgi:hypothetical protein
LIFFYIFLFNSKFNIKYLDNNIYLLKKKRKYSMKKKERKNSLNKSNKKTSNFDNNKNWKYYLKTYKIILIFLNIILYKKLFLFINLDNKYSNRADNPEDEENNKEYCIAFCLFGRRYNRDRDNNNMIGCDGKNFK